MSTRLNGEHDILATKDTGHGVHATGDGLAEQHQIGFDSTPLVAEELSCAGDTSLDLVADQQSVVLVTQRSSLLQVVLVGDDDARFALDRLDQEGSHVGAGLLKSFPQSGLVVIRDWLVGAWDGATNARQIRAIVLTRLGIRRKRDGGKLPPTSVDCAR